MTTFIICFLVVLNFGISWFNAWSVGRSWAETELAGGIVRFMAWCGAVMSACGFTWVYLVFIGVGLRYFHYLNDKWLEVFFNLGYLAIILPVLGSGIAITIESWMIFWQRKTWMNGGVATYNTFAQISNTYQAFSAIPEAIENVTGAFKSDDDEEDKGMGRLALIAVLFAIAGGMLTTRAIILSTARSHSQAQLESWPQGQSA